MGTRKGSSWSSQFNTQLAPKPHDTKQVDFSSTMAGVNPEAAGLKVYPSVMETVLELHTVSVDGRSDDASLMHFPAIRPVAARSSGQNKVTPSPTMFTILYKGNMCIYEGIPAEKVREILLIASVSAKSAEMKSGIPLTSLITKGPSSPQDNSTNLSASQSVCFPAKKSSIGRLQDEFPLARRQSLQRFLEKRRYRLANRAPYAAAKKVVHNFYPDSTPDFGSLNYPNKDFSLLLLPL
ncbi:hypothetical protein VNO78_23142 [Psophocarpus tetragonolobus]|uniref:Protein TIFY n=1 Tax=Psophocarpus tetragonolobus TaxID=3891 RepID=A0AAN9S309_PSOTE